MDPIVAGPLAMTASFAVATCAAVWYVVPWLRTRPMALGLTVLLWIHVPRYVALQIFSSVEHGLGLTDSLRDQIAYGDVLGAVLAFAAIALFRFAPKAAPAVTWLFVVATVIDLANAGWGGVREEAFATATDTSWLILTFYVPILWVSVGLVAWRLRVGDAVTD